jgi:hypothetical protein
MLIHRREEVPAAEMDPRDTLSLYYSFLPPDPGKSQHFLPQASKALRRRKKHFQGDQIRRIFAYWAIVFFGLFLEKLNK